MLIPVLSPEQSAEWDRRAVDAGTALGTLMDAAGRAVAHVVAARFPERLSGGVLIAVGPGNNGGDGWVIARVLHRLEVPVFVAAAPGDLSPLNRQMADLAQGDGVRMVDIDGPWPAVTLGIDALLGTGAHGPLRPAVATLVQRLTELAVPLIAVDGPTGVDLATGVVHGLALVAQVSVTFGGLRRGHLLARDESGDIVVVDVGHPPADPTWPTLMTDQAAAGMVGLFSSAAHKGSRGHVVVLGGAAGMSGAVRLAARASFAAGAGLVHAVAPAATIDHLLGAEPDLQTLPHNFDLPLSPALRDLLDRADAVVIGPGLGRDPGRLAFVTAVIRQSRAVVLDADGLNAFTGELELLRELSAARRLVLTPHPGEFRRLFPELASNLELNPWDTASRAAELIGVTLLAKGVPSVVATPGRPPVTVASGNPGLATGGSGDILSGISGSFLAAGQSPDAAVALAAHALGRAADLAARRTTARGLRPMDVVAALPDLWRAWESLRQLRPAPRPPVLLELEAPQRW
ncbi:MAG: NAD(P)H-hydrate dehydratase [Gemmatimonadales bacterium]